MLDELLRVALDFWLAPLPDEAFLLPDDGKQRLTRARLRWYQVLLVEKIKGCFAEVDPLPGLILALPPGAGKTGTVLTALRDLLDEGQIQRALIVAPLLVAQTVWQAEIDEWEHTRGTTHTLIRVEDDDPDMLRIGDAAYAEAFAQHQQRFDDEVAAERSLKPAHAKASVRVRWERQAREAMSEEDQAKKRKPKCAPSDFAETERQALVAAAKEAKLRALSRERTEIHIINKEALPWLWANFRNGHAWPYDVIVADDLREIRSGKKRSKGGAKDEKKGAAPLSRWGVLAQARKRVRATIELTGTPTPKGLEGTWGLAYLIDLGERLGRSKTAFLQRWFDVSRFDHSVKARPHAFDEIMGLIRDLMFSLDEKDIGELPEFILDPIRVKLPAKALAEYKRFETKMVSEEYDVEAVNGGVLHSKLLQFANGSMYQEDGNDIPIHDVKLEALRDLIARLDGIPLLVAYSFQFDVDRICAAFPHAVVLRPENAVETVKLWNADKINILLAHRASAGHGLNMQKGTGHMCEYGLTSDAELFLQFKKRIQRPGRKLSVINHVIVAEGTIDEDVYPLYLNPKIETQNRILEAVRLQGR